METKTHTHLSWPPRLEQIGTLMPTWHDRLG
jgi:hypothetical protein